MERRRDQTLKIEHARFGAIGRYRSRISFTCVNFWNLYNPCKTYMFNFERLIACESRSVSPLDSLKSEEYKHVSIRFVVLSNFFSIKMI